MSLLWTGARIISSPPIEGCETEGHCSHLPVFVLVTKEKTKLRSKIQEAAATLKC